MWAAETTEEAWHACREPFSFYHDFIARYWAGGPSEETGAAIHRLCTLARKMSVASLLVEDVLTRPDVNEEIKHLQSFLPRSRGSYRACAITFLTGGRKPRGSTGKLLEKDILGQAVVITFPLGKGQRSYVYEAIFRLPGKGPTSAQLLNNYVSVCGLLGLTVRGQEFRIPSAYFCQQNGVTSICAHSAVRTLVRTKTDKRASVAELNRLWDITKPGGSVSSLQLREALLTYGLHAKMYDVFDSQTSPEGDPQTRSEAVWKLLTLLADAGSATLLMLSAGKPVDHVVSVLGNTLNSDEWHPVGTALHTNGERHSTSSSSWIDHLVIHDDMLGPYYCLSRAGMFQEQPEAPLPRMVLAVLPENIEVSPPLAELMGRSILTVLMDELRKHSLGEGLWWETLLRRTERHLFRTTLVDRNSYCDMLQSQGGRSRHLMKLVERLRNTLPDQMWMCEISLPNLYLSGRRKLGEILIDGSASTDEIPMRKVLAFRLPSLLGWPDKKDPTGSVEIAFWPETGHCPIHAPYRHENQW